MSLNRWTAQRYVNKIRNDAKREYAQAYMQWWLAGRIEGEEPQPRCGVMAAQAVAMNIAEMAK